MNKKEAVVWAIFEKTSLINLGDTKANLIIFFSITPFELKLELGYSDLFAFDAFHFQWDVLGHQVRRYRMGTDLTGRSNAESPPSGS